MDCLFCNIIAGKIPSTFIYDDELVIAINDINPQAEHHKIIIPRKHIATLNDLNNEYTLLIGHMVQCATRIAKQSNIADPGYRLVMNCNAQGGQTVYHIHLHLIGGRHMSWPPG